MYVYIYIYIYTHAYVNNRGVLVAEAARGLQLRRSPGSGRNYIIQVDSNSMLVHSMVYYNII